VARAQARRNHREEDTLGRHGRDDLRALAKRGSEHLIRFAVAPGRGPEEHRESSSESLCTVATSISQSYVVGVVATGRLRHMTSCFDDWKRFCLVLREIESGEKGQRLSGLEAQSRARAVLIECGYTWPERDRTDASRGQSPDAADGRDLCRGGLNHAVAFSGTTSAGLRPAIAAAIRSPTILSANAPHRRRGSHRDH
jgi:hypothetical protein